MLIFNIEILKYGVFIIFIVFFLLFFYKNRKKFDGIDKTNNEIIGQSKGKYKFLLIIPALIVFLIAIIPDIGTHLYNDEFRWIAYPGTYDRSVTPMYLGQYGWNYFYADTIIYFNSLFNFDLNGTTVVLTSGLTKVFTQTFSYPYFSFFYNTQNFSWDTYYTLSRLGVVLFNLIGLGFIIFFLRKITHINIIILGVIGVLLFPLFQGYTRIVNHDSINGITLLLPILGLINSLVNGYNKKNTILSGIFFSLAIFTSPKSEWLLSIMLFTSIITYFIKSNNIDNFNKNDYINSIIYFFYNLLKYSLLSSIIIAPLIIIYPNVYIDLFLGNFLFINVILFYLIYLLKFINEKYIKIINDILKFFLRLFSLLLILYFSFIILYKNNIFYDFVENIKNYKDLSVLNYLNISYLNFLVFQPLSFTILSIFCLINIIFKRKINIYDYLLVAFVLLVGLMSIFAKFSKGEDISNFAHAITNGKYIIILYIPIIFFIFLSLKDYIKNNYIFYFIISIIFFNYGFDKYNSEIKQANILYQNQLYNNNILHYSEWFSHLNYAIEYINSDNNFKSKNIVYYGWISQSLRERIPESNILDRKDANLADYLIIPYSFNHKYNDSIDSGVIYHYYNNIEPVWKIEYNGDIVIGIWENNKDITNELMINSAN